MPDPKLRAVVNLALEKNEVDAITKGELKSLTIQTI
jgi:hypothetical protein